MSPTVLNTAGEREREMRSRRANALDAFGVACVVLFALWPLGFGWGVLGHASWASSVSKGVMSLAFVWVVLGSPRWHGDTLESLGLGSPRRLYRLICDRSGASRWRVIAVFLAVFSGMVWFCIADWPDAAKFFRFPRSYRVPPETAAHWAAISLLGVCAAALIASCAIRYDNVGSAFGWALKIAVPFLAFALLAAWLSRGPKAFAKFEWRDHTLDVATHVFWGLLQQLTFTAYFATRLRKAFGPSAIPSNTIVGRNRLAVVCLGGLAAGAVLGPVVWLTLRAAHGSAVPLALLAGCSAFAIPVGVVWTHFFCHDKKRMLVATLAGSFFGLIHIDSYGLVLCTVVLGTGFAYAAMEDRFRNLAAFAFVHGLLGATVTKLFAYRGILQISLSVGPWAVKKPSAVVLWVPIIGLLAYAALAVWAARSLPRVEVTSSRH